MEDSTVRRHSKKRKTEGKKRHDTGNPNENAIPSFASFELDARLLKAITKQFEKPTLVQAAAIPVALKGRDIVLRAKTGSGKTLAYVIPIVHQILAIQSTKSIALILVPTKELAEQVTRVFNEATVYCGKVIRAVNITAGSEQVQKTQLSQSPNIIISTPSRVLQHVTISNLSLQSVHWLVIDEADLILSYGHDSDLQQISTLVPKTVQTYLMSATLSEDIHTLKTAMCRNPAILKLEEAERETDTLTQYYVECAEDDKFLFIYVILKLKLLRGKCVIFVNDIDRCYRVKLFLEQFGIRSCVLNAELPSNSRLHIVEEFNKGVYEIILATDEANISNEPASDDEESEEHANASRANPKKHKRSDPEYGVSRGIDFHNVSFVVNFDLPQTSKSYLHRIGRTARAGAQGTAISFVIPPHELGKSKHSSVHSAKNDTKVLARIRSRLETAGRREIEEYRFDATQVDAFRYRLNDALRAVTKAAVHQARAQEIRKEILASEKLKRHFEDNPAELEGFRHDEDARIVRRQAHLKHVPDYLLPGGGGGQKDLGFIGYRKKGENRIRKARLQARYKRKGGKSAKPRRDPLKSFKP